MKKLFLVILIGLFVSCVKVTNAPLDEEDGELVALLNELDKCQNTGDHEQCFKLYSQIAAEYEKKNLTELQKQYQKKMLSEAEVISNNNKVYGHILMAEALQQLATAYMVEGILDSASIEAHQAYQLAPKDTLDFRAQTLLLLVYPKVVQTDLYRITHAYGLNLQNRNEDLMAVLPSYISECGIHGQAELTRLLMYHHQEANQWREAYDDAINLMDITDSIARSETSENMARIHELQHERQMEFQRAERKAEQARLYVIIIAVLLLLLAAAVAGLFYRRKARIAHDKELEAMRLSEAAQANENLVREENIKLQRLYYEHLYAIILPILNAHRGKSGHINLEESSWELIEKNTDIVLPGFTSRLRRQHPTLTTEDVRFCCLLMMRVPNALLADVYGIAPSSVAVRKQRMKKKLDNDMQNQTIEDYLNQYII